LKTPEGQELLHKLVAQSDGLLDNLRGDLPEKLGLTYEDLKEVNPKIVCAHLSAYGREGSRKDWPGYDYLMQAEAGYLSVTGDPDGAPERFGLSVVDLMTGLMTVFGLVSGIVGARANGKGMDVDVSLFDTALHNVGYLASWYLNSGHVQGREARSSHPSLTPSQLYRTKDGWLFVMCNKEKFWPVLARQLGHEEWADDPRFSTFKARLENRMLVTEMLDEVLMQRTTAEWLEHLSGVAPVAPVFDVKEALENPFVEEQGRVGPFTDEKGEEKVRMLTGPVRVAGETLPNKAGPTLGADTDAILDRIGVDAEKRAGLKAKKII